MPDDTTPAVLSVEEWETKWKRLDARYDFVRLARDWHSGQWSGFYRLQGNGRILDIDHACDVHLEARRNVDNSPHQLDDDNDLDAMIALRDICDIYPDNRPEDD